MSRKNANFSLQRRSRAREEPVVARSDVVASPAPRPKSWTWIVKTEKKEKGGGERRAGGRARGKSKVKQPYERNSREVRPTRQLQRGWSHRGWRKEGEEKIKE